MRYRFLGVLVVFFGGVATIDDAAGEEVIVREQHGDWHLTCVNDLLTDRAKCSLSSVTSAGGTKMLASLEQLPGYGGVVLLLTGPDLEFDSAGGFRVDDGPVTRLSTIGARISCKVTDMPRCVVVDSELNKELVASMHRGRQLRVVARTPQGMARFEYDLAGFGQAADRLRDLFREHCGNDAWKPCAKP